MEARSELHLTLDKDEPRRVAEAFEGMAVEHGVPMDVAFKFQLALDELLTNVVAYAFDEPSDPVITVVLHLTDSGIQAVIKDNGRPFNPLRDAPAPELDLSAEDRAVGGLGIHLTKAFVETLDYERKDGWNRLSLVQPLSAHPEEHA